MTDNSNRERRLVIVVDPQFGEKLRDIWPGAPVWIVMSETNEPAIQAIWGTDHETDHFIGITGFALESKASPEENFLENLDTIDLHHGSFSTNEPYTSLRVIGAKLNNEIRSALSNLGFNDFVEQEVEFVAVRTPEEALMDRANRTP